MMENATPMPPAVSAALDHPDSFPAGLRAMRDHAEHLLDGMPKFHADAISDTYTEAGIFSDGFWYAVGVQVGRALAEGVEIDESEAVRMLADAHAGWEADYGVHVRREAYMAAELHRQRTARRNYLGTA